MVKIRLMRILKRLKPTTEQRDQQRIQNSINATVTYTHELTWWEAANKLRDFLKKQDEFKQ